VRPEIFLLLRVSNLARLHRGNLLLHGALGGDLRAAERGR